MKDIFYEKYFPYKVAICRVKNIFFPQCLCFFREVRVTQRAGLQSRVEDGEEEQRSGLLTTLLR